MLIEKALAADPREEKLPQWAREKLRDLRWAAQDAAKLLSELKLGAEASPFYLEKYSVGSPKFYLPKHSRFMFENGSNKLEICDQQQSPRLKIYAHDGALILHPVASNVVELECELRR